MSRSPLEIYWDRDVQQRRISSVKQKDIPHDGASWVMMVNFFGVVGMADARIRPPKFINPIPIMNKYLELNHPVKKK